MKKNYFLISLSVIAASFLWNVFAANAQAESSNGTSTPVTLDYRYNAILEFFLQNTTEKNYEAAYTLMGGNFPKIHKLDTFTEIVNAAGLADFNEKQWINVNDKIKDIGVTAVTGLFSVPDKEVHEVTFYLIVQGETELKIADITENIPIANLAKRFPAQEELSKLILKDLRSITPLIAKNRYKKLYQYLSATAKTRIKATQVRKVLRTFKKKKVRITVPKKVAITLDPTYPQLNEQGLMLVTGSYANKDYNVTFTLAYDYEWSWKLGAFTIDAKSKTAQ